MINTIKKAPIEVSELFNLSLSETRFLTENESDYPELTQNTLLYQQVPDYGSQYFAPIVFQQQTRARYLNLARRAGLPIVDSAYSQYPPPKIRRF